MFGDRDLAAVLELIGRASAAGRSTLVAIDGLGGAGKSTLADEVRGATDGATVVPVDDFYRPIAQTARARLGPEESYRRYFDWEKLRDTVLAPLSGGSPSRYQRYDWAADALADWREVRPGSVVIVGGVFSTRPELRSFYAVTVFVDTPREQRLARMLGRAYDDVSWVEHWMAAEDWYMANARPAEHVDVVLDGSS
jgi:uridine kinase